MSSLLLVVFILQLSLHVINTVGASTINELLWSLWNKLPTPTSTSACKAQALKKDIFKLKRELANTSAQDNFSTWARLDRQHNKAMTEFQKLDGSLRTHQATFTSAVSTLRWIGTQGLRVFLQFWYAKRPMFWIPKYCVPYYAEWVLSFPRAPLGSVSINIWGIACASMILLVSDALAATWALITKKHVPLPGKEEPMSFMANAKPSSGGKKEL